MNDKEFNDYRENRYYAEIGWYNQKALKYKILFYSFQIAVIVTSALTPILAILELKWITAIIAAIVAILTSLLQFLKLQENWINYRTTCETLRKEEYYFNASLSDYKEVKNKEELFVERVEALISRENTLWLSVSSKSDEKKESKN
jgi:hypothetical protein